jgi:membrane-associated phospholipid phosphatase
MSTSSGRRQLVLWASLAIALALAFRIDGPVMEAVAPLHGSSAAEFIGSTVRWLGIGYAQIAALLLLIVVGALFRLRALPAGAWALLSFAASGIAVTILKVLIHRPRPWSDASPAGWSEYLHNSDFHSFPSGESTTTFAVAAVLAWWYPAWRVPLFAVAAVVAVARVLVGSHHPSDVVAGALLGIGVAQLLTRSAQRKRRRGSSAGT